LPYVYKNINGSFIILTVRYSSGTQSFYPVIFKARVKDTQNFIFTLCACSVKFLPISPGSSAECKDKDSAKRSDQENWTIYQTQDPHPGYEPGGVQGLSAPAAEPPALSGMGEREGWGL